MTTMTGSLPWAVPAKMRRGEHRPWLVIFDPLGDFQGNRLRVDDIQSSCIQPWPDGMIVWHERCGEVRIWRVNRNRWDVLSPKMDRGQEQGKVRS